MLRLLLAAVLTVVAAPAQALVGIAIVSDVHFNEWQPEPGPDGTHHDGGWAKITTMITGESWGSERFSLGGASPHLRFDCGELCLLSQRDGNVWTLSDPDAWGSYQNFSISLTFDRDIETDANAIATANFVSGRYDWGYGHHNGVASVAGPVQYIYGVPEPATWAMMIGGFALAGGALRRHRMTSHNLALAVR